jgi:hypothetical protein
MDENGNLHGATTGGGARVYGEVFKLSPAADSGAWTQTILYSFLGSYSIDGAYPFDTPIMDQEGTVYGKTTGGGAYSVGTVFQISPPADKAERGPRKCFTVSPDDRAKAGKPWDRLMMDTAGAFSDTTATV